MGLGFRVDACPNDRRSSTSTLRFFSQKATVIYRARTFTLVRHMYRSSYNTVKLLAILRKTFDFFACLIFKDPWSGWYAGNTDCPIDFFSGPAFPAYAIEQLRYSTWGLCSNEYAPIFNLRVEDGA
jgi:hypothetical protein